MIFSAEVNSVYLVWGFLLLPLLIMTIEAVYKLFSGTKFPFSDDVALLFISVPFFIYVVLACRRFYKLKYFQSLVLAIIFIIAHHYIIHLLYKFILFTIVINQIH
jgi:hypothetical protein